MSDSLRYLHEAIYALSAPYPSVVIVCFHRCTPIHTISPSLCEEAFLLFLCATIHSIVFIFLYGYAQLSVHVSGLYIWMKSLQKRSFLCFCCFSAGIALSVVRLCSSATLYIYGVYRRVYLRILFVFVLPSQLTQFYILYFNMFTLHTFACNRRFKWNPWRYVRLNFCRLQTAPRIVQRHINAYTSSSSSSLAALHHLSMSMPNPRII